MPTGIYNRAESKWVPWNKGLRGAVEVSAETRAKLRKARAGRKPGLGRKQSDEEKQKRRAIMLRLGIKPPNCKGYKHSAQARLNMSVAQRAKGYMQHARGERAPNWKGGVSSRNHVARTSKAFTEWRTQVFARDNWTCRQCGARGVHLHPHHVKEFAEYPQLRFDIDNGLTLCRQCHLALHGLLPRKAA